MTTCWLGSDRQEVLLVKPQTFMNESGRSVGRALKYFNLPIESAIVFHDELDLVPGKVRVKLGGGVAGHNGLRSIKAHAGNESWRVRIGIGHPRDLPGRLMDVADYVLRKPHLEEQIAIDIALSRSLDVMPLFLKGETESAVRGLHSSC